jgi:tetratricopeptide (TPR) repeat protein
MESWYNLNTAYLKTGMYQEALDSTQKSLEYLGGNTHLLHLRALALTNAGWPDEGRKIWELILQYIPGNRDANISLAEFFAKTGRHEQALYYFHEAEKTGPLSSALSEIKRTIQAQLSTMR